MTTSASMSLATPAELLYGDFAGEHAATRRMLERYPDGKGEWRPDAKSSPLGQLATHVAGIVARGTMVLETDGMDVSSRPAVNDLSNMNDEDFAKTWTVRRGEQVMFNTPKKVAVRGWAFSHMIHHRGQLSVYLRLLDVPVPGMYGPSADD